MSPKYPYKKMVLPKELEGMKDETGKLKPDQLKEAPNGAKFWSWAGIAFSQMFNDAKKAGINLQNIGDYRSYEQQLAMFKERYSTTDGGRKPQVTRTWDGKTWYLKPGMSPSSSPGKSNHGLGLAIDINVTKAEVLNWLCENAPSYGFYLQSDNPASPEFENWHWQYVCGDATPEAVKTRYETNQAKKQQKDSSVEAIAVALIGLIGALMVALIEKGRRENKSDHSALGEKVELIGKSLGISIDRVERGVERTEQKIDQHIADHARGEFVDD